MSPVKSEAIKFLYEKFSILIIVLASIQYGIFFSFFIALFLLETFFKLSNSLKFVYVDARFPSI